MKKVFIGIFAHPDDEAFGPGGTLLKLRDEGYDIHLILLTDGEAGTNSDAAPDLAAVRLAEWRAAAQILGASSAHALHYPDGALETVSASELDTTTSSIMTKILESYSEPVQLSFMTFEPHGLTGHRDHIAASGLTTRMAGQFAPHEVWYFCLASTQAPLEGTAYYQPRAREDSYITHKVAISPYQAHKHRAIDAHVSQRADGAIAKTLAHATECFHVETS